MKYAVVITMLYAALASTAVTKLDALQEHDSDIVRQVPLTVYEEKVYEETRYDPIRRGLPPIIEEEEYEETRY
ncbi:hypothetical protein BBO_08422 [Beauveria brongniartii RCEF 3172]|uniref:Uncharacterized protein n=1 Tax=Beauveria brongniartii RCEF 3172 TaxID=1081107 RepID=A0A166XN34_9HYPO|nr:hypothetical protein BBO_08422 [Beauveria brongniartii RCEF 3172]